MNRAPRYGLARILSKRGLCSRTQAIAWITEGRVRVAGRVVRDPEQGFPLDVAGLQIAGDAGTGAVDAAPRVYIALNKPRGLVTTTRDERGRDTVYACLADAGLPWLAPVGRLDRASEGLLLLSNDSAWAARITSPDSHIPKRYHVQVDRVPDAAALQAMRTGVQCDGTTMAMAAVTVLRSGGRTAWLDIELDEGRNRQIRRILAALDIGVHRLVRVAIGPLALGELPKGGWRHLREDEVRALASPG